MAVSISKAGAYYNVCMKLLCWFYIWPCYVTLVNYVVVTVSHAITEWVVSVEVRLHVRKCTYF